ncbi:MAG: CBS domain-containing protein [Lachnospiraceae bacterium]|nr:CBS domain-containing protein [Lachnospiraceae bacterium]
MNILFFLTPKAEVAFLDWNYSLRQVLEKMETHKYSSIPILSNDGEYVGTLTEGDMLWYLYNNDTGMSRDELEEMPLTVVPRRIDYEPVNASSNMEDLLSKIMKQNFVPVVDDCDNFIGIVKRKDVIQYYYDRA